MGESSSNDVGSSLAVGTSGVQFLEGMGTMRNERFKRGFRIGSKGIKNQA